MIAPTARAGPCNGTTIHCHARRGEFTFLTCPHRNDGIIFAPLLDTTTHVHHAVLRNSGADERATLLHTLAAEADAHPSRSAMAARRPGIRLP